MCRMMSKLDALQDSKYVLVNNINLKILPVSPHACMSDIAVESIVIMRYELYYCKDSYKSI